MDVYYYDLVEKLALGNASKIDSLDELLSKVDILTLHVDGRPENQMIFGEEHFKAMKSGSVFINLSRGFVVDIEALVKYLKNGHIRGAAIDVFPQEPKSNQEEFLSELRGLENVILTPHVGGSTEEAQINIAEYVPARIIDYINTGSTFGSVNFPNLQLPAQQDCHRLIDVHKNVPGILASINQLFSEHKINIAGQYLKTNDRIGYVITDVSESYPEEILQGLREIEGTVRFRVLY